MNDKTGRVSGGISEDQFIAFVRALDKAEEIDEDEVAEDAADAGHTYDAHAGNRKRGLGH